MRQVINVMISTIVWSLIIHSILHSIAYIVASIIGDDAKAIQNAIKALWAVGILLLIEILDINPLMTTVLTLIALGAIIIHYIDSKQ